MDDDADALADHLVKAARAGQHQGLTREEFKTNAGVFWDVVQKMLELGRKEGSEDG